MGYFLKTKKTQVKTKTRQNQKVMTHLDNNDVSLEKTFNLHFLPGSRNTYVALSRVQDQDYKSWQKQETETEVLQMPSATDVNLGYAS